MSETTAESSRRTFLGALSAGALAATAGIVVPAGAPSTLHAEPPDETWLSKITGKHKQVYDAVNVNEGWALVFAMNYLDTNTATYNLKDSDISTVVGCRHFAIPLVFDDTIWAKYKLGEFAKVTDPQTKAPSVRNIYYHSKTGDMMFPNASVDKLMARGTQFTCCNVALTALSGLIGKGVGMAPDAAKKEWLAHIIPGTTVVPSGVLALGRAQEKGCTYCYGG